MEIKNTPEPGTQNTPEPDVKNTPEPGAQNTDNANDLKAAGLPVVEVKFGSVKKSGHSHHSHSSDGSGSGGHSHHSHGSDEKSGSSHRKHRKHKRSRSRKKKMKKWKKVLIAVCSAVLALALLATGIFFYMRSSGKDKLTSSPYTITAPKSAIVKNDGYTIEYNGKTYAYKKDAVNMLFMGIDRRPDEAVEKDIGDNNLADVIIVLSIDLSQNKMTFVNVPRDTITDVVVRSKTGGYTGIEKLPIAMSYSYGDGKQESCINTLDAVRKMFYNIPISSYISMEISGISVVNDEIGGVDVTCPEDVYYGSELRFSKGESYHLEGKQANDFVILRTHETADANLLRNERQKIYIKAFMDKAIQMSKSDLSTPLKIYRSAEDYSITNITADGVTYLATELLRNGTPKTDMKTLPVDVKQVENHAENYLREEEFYELILSVFYEEIEK